MIAVRHRTMITPRTTEHGFVVAFFTNSLPNLLTHRMSFPIFLVRYGAKYISCSEYIRKHTHLLGWFSTTPYTDKMKSELDRGYFLTLPKSHDIIDVKLLSHLFIALLR